MEWSETEGIDDALPPRHPHERHHRSGRRSRAWRVAILAVPPVAIIAALLGLVAVWDPSLGVLPVVRYVSFGLILVLGELALLLLLDARKSSRRFHRPKYWVALLSTVGLAGLLAYGQLRAFRIHGPYQPPPPSALEAGEAAPQPTWMETP